MKKKIIILVSFLFVSHFADADSLADELLPNQSENVQINTNNVLQNKFIVNKNFYNISSVAQTLNNLGIITTIKLLGDNDPHNLYIKSNSNIYDFINIAATKFNYSWIEQNNSIIFSSLNPIKKQESSSIALNKKKNDDIKIINRNISIPQPVTHYSLNTSDRKLRNALSKWCKQAGWQLVWNTKVDYDITTNWPEIPGSFESAVNKVLIATQGSDTPLYAIMYDSNKVLEIRSNDN